MAPRVFYRVEDADSGARFVKKVGILAADTDTVVDFEGEQAALPDQVKRHLDWGNRIPTPFISTYSSEFTARNEAERRLRRGKVDVTIYKIDTRSTHKRVEYRDVRRLADKLRVTIQDEAWHNSKYEWIFLHCVPDDAVEVWERF